MVENSAAYCQDLFNSFIGSCLVSEGIYGICPFGIGLRKTPIPWQLYTKFSTIAYTYNAMLHLKSRRLNPYLLLKDYSVIIERETEERETGMGRKGGGNPYTYKTESWKITSIKKKKKKGETIQSRSALAEFLLIYREH